MGKFEGRMGKGNCCLGKIFLMGKKRRKEKKRKWKKIINLLSFANEMGKTRTHITPS